MICDNCDCTFDCTEPCEEAIAWEKLTETDRMEKDSYKAKGVSLSWTDINGNRPPPFKESMK